MINSIYANELGKAYEIFDKPIDGLKEFLLRRCYHKTFWALQNVNLTLPRGASLGVVGENGAGKTTFLQLLAGTISPTCGTIERNGRTSAILELGSGFHPELSGVENIRLGCAMFGLTPSETEKRLPEIIAFSELEKFVDRPVRTYSTGMYARLAFSVSTSVNPDILVVDEALSVGDQHFQKKCIDHMMAFLEQGNTLIFCTHNLYFIQQICDLCLWLRNGQPAMLGPTMEVIEEYQDYARSRDADTESVSLQPDSAQPEGQRFGGETHLREVTLGGDCRHGAIETGQTLKIRVVARVAPAAKVEGVHVGIRICRNDKLVCYGVSTEMDNIELQSLTENDHGVSFVVEELPLLAGCYSVEVVLLDKKGVHIYDLWKGVSLLKVRHGTAEVGLVRLVHRWERL